MLNTKLSPFVLLLVSAVGLKAQITLPIPITSVSGLSSSLSNINNSISALQVAMQGVIGKQQVYSETLTGPANGSNKVFSVQYIPTISASVVIHRNGVKLTVPNDFTVSGKTITFVFPPQVDDLLSVDYVTGPQASPSPSAFSFGTVAMDTASAQTITISNAGPTATVLSSTAITGQNAADYQVTNSTCGGSISPGASCTIAVTVNSGHVGPSSATLVLTDSGAGSPQSVNLSATISAPSVPVKIASAFYAGTCLDAASTPQANGTLTNLIACNGATSQVWSFAQVSGGYKVTESSSNLQLDVQGGPSYTADGTPICLYTYWGGSNEIWNVQSTPDGYVNILVSNSGKCLTGNGSAIEVDTCSGSFTQKWSLSQ